MTTLHLVQDWTWRGYLAVLVLVVLPPALAGWSGDGPGSVARAVVVGEVATAVLVLLAALASYVQYRLTDDPAMGWLCLGTIVVGARCLGVAVLQSGTAEGHLVTTDWLALADLAAVTMLAALSRLRCRTVDPIVPGAAVATGLTVVYLVLPERVPPVDLPVGVDLAAHGLAVVVGIVVALHVVRVHGLVYGSAVPTAAFVLLSAGQVGGTHVVEHDLVGQAFLMMSLAGTVLLVGAVLGRLRSALDSQLEHLSLVRGRLAAAQQDLRDQRSRLHEVANSMAGIASATRLIHEDSALTGPRRLRLESMLDDESARLARVLGRGSQPVDGRAARTGQDRSVEPVDLDRVLAPLVVAHEVTDHPVSWQPSGLTAAGRADDIAEAVSILLDNTRKHAPHAAASLLVQRGDDATVRIVVSDDGPGISPDVSDALFTWGGRRDDSEGQGIGLHLAERLIHDISGSLVVLPTASGTTFVISLPTPRSSRGPTPRRHLVAS